MGHTQKCHVPEAVQTFTDAKNLPKWQILSALTHYVQRALALCPILPPGPHCSRKHGANSHMDQCNIMQCCGSLSLQVTSFRVGVIAHIFRTVLAVVIEIIGL